MDAIVAQDITKHYSIGKEDFAALKGISFTIETGTSLAIMGKSGSGKSTLMHILATLDRPTSGQLTIQAQDTIKMSAAQLGRLRNQTFGFVFQQFFLNARNTCLENVVLPLVVEGIKPKERQLRGLAMLELVGLADKAKQKANDLSGGQKQRLCIARALVAKPQVIFADEPTGNLDTHNGKIVMDLLFKLQQEQGITLIMVTHDPDLAAMCQRQLTLQDGLLVKGDAS